MSTARGSGMAALVCATLCWGSVVVLIKIATRGVTVLALTAVEIAVTVAVLGCIVAARGERVRRPDRGEILAGVLEPGLAYPLINAGLERTSGTHGALIIGLESVVIVLGSAAVDHRRPSLRLIMALLLTAIGTVVLTGTGDDGSTASLGGDLLVLLGIAAASGYVLMTQRRSRPRDAISATLVQFAVGGLALLPFVIVGAVAAGSPSTFWGHPTGGQVGAVLATGIVGSAIAFILYNWALGRVSGAAAGIVLALIPVFGVGFSIVFLDETLTGATVLAVLVVLAGVLIAGTAATPRPAPAALAPPDHVPTALT